MSYRQKADLEGGFDFGITEISVDGGEIDFTAAKVTGENGRWNESFLDLSPWLKDGANEVVVRSRLKSDVSQTLGGWLVADVRYLAAAR